MLYLIAIIIGVFVFISIFYIKIQILLSLFIIFFLANIILQKSLIKSLKRFLYILPYFLGILILQTIIPRGEFYNILGLKLDKIGFDFTVLYFIKLITILYFLTLFFFILNKIPKPKNKIFTEVMRISIFMSIVKKSFFSELKIIKNSKSNFYTKLSMIKKLIDNVYKASFKNYPYNEYLINLLK